MPKQWTCDKGCNKTIQWPVPYQKGNKPVNMDGSPHNCLPGGPDHIAGQIANAPASAPPTTQQTEIQGQGGNLGKDLEQKLYDNAQIITVEIIKRAIAYTKATIPTSEDAQEIQNMRYLFASVMAQVIAK